MGDIVFKTRWLAPLLLFACAFKYPMDKRSETSPAASITEMRVSTKSTKVTFRYAPKTTRRVGVHPPGHAGAFRISTVDGAESWPLEKIHGVATLPERTTVEAETSIEFTLTFAAIPEELRLLNIGEGEYRPDAGEKSLQFFDVRLEYDYPHKETLHGEGEQK